MLGAAAGIAGLAGIGMMGGAAGDALGQMVYASTASSAYAPYTNADVEQWFPTDASAGTSALRENLSFGFNHLLAGTFQLNTAVNAWYLGRSTGLIGIGNTLGDFYNAKRLGHIEGNTKLNLFLGDAVKAAGSTANYIARGDKSVPKWMDSLFGLGGTNRTNPGKAGFSAYTGLADYAVTSTNRIEAAFGKYGITGQTAKDFRQHLLTGAYEARERSTAGNKFMRSWFSKRQAQYYDPIGKVLSQSGSISEFMERVQNPEAKRLTFRYSKSTPYARTARAMEAGTIHAMKQTLGADGYAAAMKTGGAQLQSDIQKFAVAGTNRVRLLSTATRIARAGAALTILPALAGAAFSGAQEVFGRGVATLNALQRMDFGGGDVLDSARLATERQRQMMAIQNSGLNARGLLGSEASYYR